MVGHQLTFEQLKWILECYCRNDAKEVKRCWKNQFETELPTGLTTSRLKMAVF
jgi:hypothetical protein